MTDDAIVAAMSAAQVALQSANRLLREGQDPLALALSTIPPLNWNLHALARGYHGRWVCVLESNSGTKPGAFAIGEGHTAAEAVRVAVAEARPG